MKVSVKPYCGKEAPSELRTYVASVLTQGTDSGGLVEDLGKQIETIAAFLGALVENMASKNILTLHEITQILPGEGWTKISKTEV